MSTSRPPAEVHGRQVMVRRYSSGDAVQLDAAISMSIDHLLPWMPWAQFEPLELSDRERLLQVWIDQWDRGEDFNFAIFRDRQLVGSCGLHRRIGPSGLEIGYWTRASAIRQGIATDAAGCLVRAAFSMPGIDHVEIHHDVANVASGHVAARLGFATVDGQSDAASASAQPGTERVWRLDRRGRDGSAVGDE
ncbi:MAG: GNAT family N-acetyltransferase [Actinomycetota bacterium]